jgi:hypothetical protein
MTLVEPVALVLWNPPAASSQGVVERVSTSSDDQAAAGSEQSNLHGIGETSQGDLNQNRSRLQENGAYISALSTVQSVGGTLKRRSTAKGPCPTSEEALSSDRAPFLRKSTDNLLSL